MNILLISFIAWIVVFYNRLQFSEGTCNANNNGVYYTQHFHYPNIGQLYRSPNSSIKTSVMDRARFDMRLATHQCFSSCQEQIQPKCVAVNFNTENVTCELLSTQPLCTFDQNIVHDEKWTLYTEKKIAASPLQNDCSECPSYTGTITIQTTDGNTFEAYCNDGWLYLSRRFDGSQDFYKTYAEYRSGFGDPIGEYFLGLDNLVSVLNQGGYTLRVDLKMWPPESTEAYAQYTTFQVADASDSYRINIGGYEGIAGDSLNAHNGMMFSAKDNDQDNYATNCAEQFKGAFWYAGCHSANLFGIYNQGPVCPQIATCITWLQWPETIGNPNNYCYSFMESALKIYRQDHLLP